LTFDKREILLGHKLTAKVALEMPNLVDCSFCYFFDSRTGSYIQLLGVGYYIWEMLTKLCMHTQNAFCLRLLSVQGKAVEVGGVDFCIYAMFIAWQHQV
jgi:hypothetical protein